MTFLVWLTLMPSLTRTSTPYQQIRACRILTRVISSALHMEVKLGWSESPQIMFPELLGKMFTLPLRSAFEVPHKIKAARSSFYSVERGFLKIKPSRYEKASKYEMKSVCFHHTIYTSIFCYIPLLPTWVSSFIFQEVELGFYFWMSLNESTERTLINLENFIKPQSTTKTFASGHDGATGTNFTLSQ